MRISELRAALDELTAEHGDVDILVAADPEGNQYFPAKYFSIDRYLPSTTMSGNVPIVNPDDPASASRGTPAVVLWP
jgi:hypothetical protein